MLALVTALALAHPIPLHDSTPLHERARGELSCQVVASADPSLQDRWHFVSSVQFEARSNPTVLRGQRFLFACFIGGYGVDDEGSADLTYSIRISRPDGETYFESELVACKREVPDPSNMLLADELAGCFFEPLDPLGTYSASIRLTDGVTGATAEATTTVELVEYEEGAGFDSLEAFTQWKQGYTSSPDTTRIVPALWEHCRNAGFQAEAKDLTGDGFFLELLDGNEWLFPEILAGLEKRTENERFGALWLLAHTSAETAPLVDGLSEDEKARWSELSATAHDPMSEPLSELRDLNEVYGRYLASQSLAPLLRLILALHADGDAISDESVRSEEHGVDVPVVMVVPKVVGSLLGRLFRADPVARGYAETLLDVGELPPSVADALAKLLADLPK